jgi:hypothetical protein
VAKAVPITNSGGREKRKKQKKKSKEADKSFLRAADAKARGDKEFRLDAFCPKTRFHSENPESTPQNPTKPRECHRARHVFCPLAAKRVTHVFCQSLGRAFPSFFSQYIKK